MGNNEKIISILIIEDGEKLSFKIRKYFQNKKVEIKTIQPNKTIWGEVEKQCPDLLLIDTPLPGLKKDEIMKKLNEKNKFSHIPKIFVTINALTEDRINGYNMGCNAYVPKPFDPEELGSIINNLVKQSRRRIAWIINSYIRIKQIRTKILERQIPYYIKTIYLTKQEKIILKKITEKKTNKKIAQELKITKRSVERYISRLLDKTNIKNKLLLQDIEQ